MKRKRLFVIDGHALCYRAYYAFIKNPLTNSRGQNISAIFGFARMLYSLVTEQGPDYLMVAFDPPVKSFRFDLYPEYKANRQKMPDDLRGQIDEIKNMVSTLGIQIVEHQDYEADDILGTVAARYASNDLEVMLVTGDKDAYQLVGDNVKVFANKKGISEYEIYDAAGVKNKTGLLPENIIDYMALMGDASDNVPGVKGVGEKTALKLISQYKTLEGLYEHLEEIKGKQKTMLEDSKDMAFLSRDLVTIRTDVDFELDVEGLTVPDLKSEAAAEYFRKIEMDSIVRDYIGDSAEEKHEEFDKDYRIIRTIEELKDVVAEIENAGELSVDTETTSVEPVVAEVIGMSFSIDPGKGWYLPLVNRGLFSDVYPEREDSLALVKPMLENPEIRKIGQNIKYDYIVLKNAGIEMKGLFFDTMIASYLLNPSERRHNMDDMALHFLNYRTITYKELAGTGKNAVPLTEVPLDRLCEYAVEDADITLRLYRILSPLLAENELEELFYKMEMPLLEVLANMEITGVKIDLAHFKKISEKNSIMLQAVEENIHTLAGGPFNINSTRELAHVLFDVIGLKPVRKTKTGFSTDIKVLEALKGKHEIIDQLIQYRSLSKLKSTYIDALPKLVKSTGRIHTSYNQTIVATGRLSSSDPNLQNIPVKDELGKEIRKGFVPEKGFLMMSADYSQIELRLAAHLSGDENMKKAFNEDIDIHSMTAASVFGVGIEDVTSDMRRQAKVINFATLYGVSPYGLSQQAEIGVREAAEFIKIYFETYPGFKKYTEKTTEYARTHSFVKTVMGRKRSVPDIDSETSFRREGAERIAINTPIQGTSADMIKIAMINISDEFQKRQLKTRMIMQVHDELVFEVHHNEKDEVEKLVMDCMKNAMKLDVPVEVEMGWGKNWEEAH